MHMYQVLAVSRAIGSNFIIPDPFVYTDLISALQSVKQRISVFEEAGEHAVYKGEISTLEQIAAIYQDRLIVANTSEIYILHLDVV